MLNALQFMLLFAAIASETLKISFAKARANYGNLGNFFHYFSVFDDFGLIKRTFWKYFTMPRHATSYNPRALRIWRMLKRMGITSPRGMFLSLVFWSLFICLTYFVYTESSRFLAKIEAKKFDISKLSKLGHLRSRKDNETFDALGLFKTYWNSSTVEDLLHYVKSRTRNISANIPG